MAFSGVLVNASNSVAGRSAVYLGATVSGFNALPTKMYSVGAVEGAVSMSPNQDVIKLQRSDAQNPYAVLETAYDYQVSFSLQETDVFNLALACGYETSFEPYSATGSGILVSGLANYSARQYATNPANSPPASGHITSLDNTSNANQLVVTIDDNPDIVTAFTPHIIDESVILSGIDSSSIFSVLNGVPLESVALSGDETITFDISGKGVSSQANETTAANLGRVRSVRYLDSVSYVQNTNILTLDFAFSGSISLVVDGDYITLREVASSAPAGLKQLEGYVLGPVTKADDSITVNVSSILDNSVADFSSGTDDQVEEFALGYIDSAFQIVKGSESQSTYRSMLIRVEGGLNTSGVRQVAEYHFYKVKIAYAGSIDYDRTTAVTYPITAHCLGNNSDVVGAFLTPNDYARANDYGDS